VSFYRLIGPFKDAHQMRIVVKGELLYTVKKKGVDWDFLGEEHPDMMVNLANTLGALGQLTVLTEICRPRRFTCYIPWR
jgi:hypothetical protein